MDHALPTSSSNPAAGQGKVPVTAERMDAIRKMKTMAGSPDADLALRSGPAILRMVFVFLGSTLVNHERERYVQ
jgi:hypothetical protein